MLETDSSSSAIAIEPIPSPHDDDDDDDEEHLDCNNCIIIGKEIHIKHIRTGN